MAGKATLFGLAFYAAVTAISGVASGLVKWHRSRWKRRV